MRIAALIALCLSPALAQDAGKSVYVVTHVDVTPNYSAETAKLLQQYGADSRKDPGFVRFEVLVQYARSNHMTVVEVWQTREAFEAHLALDHSKRLRERLQPMLGSPFDERLHSAIAAIP